VKTSDNELIIKRTDVTNSNVANSCIGAPPAAKRARYGRCEMSAALAALFSVVAQSETQLVTVSGTVTDPSGAVGAEIGK
jgi:hypothetical protein